VTFGAKIAPPDPPSAALAVKLHPPNNPPPLANAAPPESDATFASNVHAAKMTRPFPVACTAPPRPVPPLVPAAFPTKRHSSKMTHPSPTTLAATAPPPPERTTFSVKLHLVNVVLYGSVTRTWSRPVVPATAARAASIAASDSGRSALTTNAAAPAALGSAERSRWTYSPDSNPTSVKSARPPACTNTAPPLRPPARKIRRPRMRRWPSLFTTKSVLPPLRLAPEGAR
jgi:hypothetical protein